MSVSLVIHGTSFLSGNIIQLTVSASEPKTNHKLLLKVTCAELFGSPFILEQASEGAPNYETKFQIQGLFDQPVEYEFDHPAVGLVVDRQKLEFNATLVVGEVWTDVNGNRQESWMNLTTGNTLRVVKGQLRPYELAKLEEEGQSFQGVYVDAGKFLTHLPNGSKVLPGQISKLWFLSPYPGYVNAEWHLNVTQVTNYGVHEYENELHADIVLDPNSGLLEFSVEPLFLGYIRGVTAQYPILSYKFWITRKDNGSTISEVRNFVVDNNYYEAAHLFYYVNPLGGVDLLPITGEYVEGLKTENETMRVPVPLSADTRVPGMKTVSATGQRFWEINTGHKTRAEIIELRDFLEAKERWMIDPDDSDYLIPVIIESDNYKLYDSMEDLHNIVIKIYEAH